MSHQYLARVNRKKKEKFQSRKIEFDQRQAEKSLNEEKLANGEEIKEKRKPKHHSQVKSLRNHRKNPKKKSAPVDGKKIENSANGEGKENSNEENSNENSEENSSEFNEENSSEEESEEEFDRSPFLAHAQKLVESTPALESAPPITETEIKRNFASALFSGDSINQNSLLEESERISSKSSELFEFDNLIGLVDSTQIATLKIQKKENNLIKAINAEIAAAAANGGAAPANRERPQEKSLDDLAVESQLDQLIQF